MNDPTPTYRRTATTIADALLLSGCCSRGVSEPERINRASSWHSGPEIGAPLVAPGGRLIVTLGAGSGVEADEVAASFGLKLGGSWSGHVGGVPRALRWYDRG